MSIQLVLYPQNYNGQFNSITTNPTEFVVNGISFVGLDSASSYDNANFQAVDVLAAAPPAIVNTWYRFRAPVGALPALPTVTSETAVFNSLGTVSVSGIYQRLSNLSVGQTYTINVNVSTTGAGTFTINVYDGTTQIATQGALASVATITTTFTATAEDNTLLFLYSASTVGNVAIEDISVTQEGSTPSVTLADGQVICDLYEDEDIPLTLSVDDFTNAAEKVQSYSKAFKLPGTKRNNKIFDNIFEITRADDGIVFNPYRKTQSVLKQDGFVLFEGFMRLIDITDQDGEISYNVNLYSEVVALAGVLQDRNFNDLPDNFIELEHDYDYTSITRSWNDNGLVFPYTQNSTSGFRSDYDTIKYPFVDWTHQSLISTGVFGTTGNPQLVKLEQAFRPFIQIRYLIQRIFAATEFSYTSSFFDSDDFKKLYMDFNWGAEENGAQAPLGNSLKQEDDISSDYFINADSYTAASKLRFNQTAAGTATYWDNTDYKYTAPTANFDVFCEYNIKLENTSATSDYSNSVRIAKFNASGQWLETFDEDQDSIGALNSKFLVGTFQTVLQLGEYIQAQSHTITDNKIRMGNDIPSSFLRFSSSNTSSLTSVLLNKLRGELGQWDFLKGIMTMFNLVSIPDSSNPNNIIIEPYADVFINNTSGISLKDRSIEYDWTDKIDVKEIKLVPLTDLNKRTNFKFAEDEKDYAFSVYKESVVQQSTGIGFLYGSLIHDASGFTILTGEEDIIAEPFAATVPKPLEDYMTDLIVPTVYEVNEDGTSQAFENLPRIMYNNGVKSTVHGYYIPAQNGGAEVSSQDTYLQFSHLSSVPTVVSVPPLTTDTQDFHFGECQLIEPIGNPTVNNLYSMYWQPYYDELYNPDTRTMTIKVNLTPGDLNTFRFYDTVMIKNRKFRVNKIDYKPNDLATVQFILIP